jgi:rare lipoprotein A (peptidoglycan hydrolase)
MTQATKWMDPMGLRAKLTFKSCSIPKSGRLAASLTLTAMLAACSSGGPAPSSSSSGKGKFDPKYGVSASARVASKKSEFRKGGGHYKIGKPYRVAGKLYRPKDEPGYNKTGKASWYGDDFHGRLTANGEIFDMNTLTAAHPTLPLPSYARVTNLKNGRSVIVRINDRGPYAHNRVIDLSKRVAEVLAFKNDGITNVRVKYIGKARMDGQDERYLEASFRKRGQPLGNDFQAVPKEGQEHRFEAPVMMASAQPVQQPAQKQQSTYIMAHVPTIQASMISPNPTPEQLSAPANAGWAPIDLVGDGYQAPGLTTASIKPRKRFKLARFFSPAFNYKPSYSLERLSQGQSAISDMLATSDKTKALKSALQYKIRLKNKEAIAKSSGTFLATVPSKNAERIAQDFARLAAIDITPGTNGTTDLHIAKLKNGVGWQDIKAMRKAYGFSN